MEEIEAIDKTMIWSVSSAIRSSDSRMAPSATSRVWRDHAGSVPADLPASRKFKIVVFRFKDA